MVVRYIQLFSHDPNKWYQSTGSKMATVTKFDILKLDGKINFHIWKDQMMTILIQNGLKKLLVACKDQLT